MPNLGETHLENTLHDTSNLRKAIRGCKYFRKTLLHVKAYHLATTCSPDTNHGK